VTYNFSFEEVKGSEKKERNNAEKRKSENL